MLHHPLTRPLHRHMLDAFKAYVTTVGYQPPTIQMLQRCSQEFLWKLEADNRELSKVESADILSHYTYLQERPNAHRPGGLSAMMVHHHLYSLRVFFDWLQRTGQLSYHPMSTLTFPRPTTTPREIVTLSEVKALYGACGSWKERALLGLFYGCGLRRSEGAGLAVNDIQFTEGLLYVRLGKGGRARAIPMSRVVRDDLQTYLVQERRARAGVSSYLLNTLGRPMSGESMNHLLQTLLHRTMIVKPITLHSLRHSIATHLLASGLSVEHVRDFLGHKHLESTQVYTRITKTQFNTWH